MRAGAFAAVLGFGIASSAQGALRYVPLRHQPRARYAFLPRYVPPDAVVITGLTSAIAVAAYSGKAIANLRPTAFVPDHAQRRADVERFLDLQTSTLDRRRIAGHYRARFLLIDRKRMAVHGDDLRRFLELGRPVFVRPDMLLVDMARRPVGDARPRAEAVPPGQPDRSP
jgi:hypothetical protein